MRKASFVLAALLAVTGICVMLWPVFTGHRLQSNAATAVQEFLADRDEPEQQYPELLQLYRNITASFTRKSSVTSLTSKPARHRLLT